MKKIGLLKRLDKILNLIFVQLEFYKFLITYLTAANPTGLSL